MSDPVLDAYRHAPRGYAISGPSPISIRDQMLRAVTLVRRLLEIGEIDAAHPLVVLGAGVGGATAAIEASTLQVETYLLEKRQNAFLTQAFAQSRFLHPTQYDWPCAHYDEGVFPLKGHPPLPLYFPASRADLLSVDWQYELSLASNPNYSTAATPAPSQLHVEYEVTNLTIAPLIDPACGPEKPVALEVKARTRAGPLRVDAGAVVLAHGFGTEACHVVVNGNLKYESPDFWAPDQLVGLNAAAHKVLISGLGDGALQDYLRIVTRRDCAIDILKSIPIPASELLKIYSAEDASLRGRSWASDDRTFRPIHERGYFRELEQLHLNVVTGLLNDSTVRGALDNIIGPTPVPVKIVYREPYLTNYYALNRFLTLLITEHLKLSSASHRTLFPCTEIKDINPVQNHQCINTYNTPPRASGVIVEEHIIDHDCFGKDHFVQFQAVYQQSVAASLLADGEFNVILVRHGLQPRSNPPLARTRHLLPYGLPS